MEKSFVDKLGTVLSIIGTIVGIVASIIPDAKIIELDPEVEHSERGQSSAIITRGNATKLIVKFPDGTVIAELKAADILVKAVKKIE